MTMRKAMRLQGPIVQHAKAIREALEDVDGRGVGFWRSMRLWWWRDYVLGAALDALKALEQRAKDGAELKSHIAALAKIMGGKVDFKAKQQKEEKDE